MAAESSGETGTEGLRPLVLVVDDDPSMRQLIQWALEDEGLAVETAADGDQALEATRGRSVALVVLDLILPGIPSSEVASGLRKDHGAALPFLLVTADGRAAEKAQQVGAYAYLRKPFQVDDLAAAVRRGLASQGGA